MANYTLLAALWLMFSFLSFFEYIEQFKDINKFEAFIATLIFIVGGPIFAANQILSTILDMIFGDSGNDKFL